VENVEGDGTRALEPVVPRRRPAVRRCV